MVEEREAERATAFQRINTKHVSFLTCLAARRENYRKRKKLQDFKVVIYIFIAVAGKQRS